MGIKKVLTAVVTGCLALLLIGPASALADRPLPAPPWDDDPSHWTGVEVSECHEDPDDPNLPGAYPTGTPCQDHVVVDNLLLTAGPPPTPVVECRIELDLKVWRDGETEVDNVTATANGGFNNANCVNVTINDEPWDNQICERVADENGPLDDHQYWDALEIDFTLGTDRIAGVIYAELLDGSGNRASGPLSVGSAFIDSEVFFPTPAPPPVFRLAGDQLALFDNDPSFVVESTDDPCQWEFPA